MGSSHCPCIATNHQHKPGQCDEPAPQAPPTGGYTVCLTCRYAKTPSRKETK